VGEWAPADGNDTVDPVRDYLREISKVPLLKAEQEVALSKRIEAGVFAEKILDIVQPANKVPSAKAFAGVASDILQGEYAQAQKRQKKEGGAAPEPPTEAACQDYARRLQRYVTGSVDGRPLGQFKDELAELVRDGQAAKRVFIEANLRLVVNIARRYTRRDGKGMGLLDLVQEGNAGLIHAVEKFDYQQGYKFSTYATWWIRQAITRAMSDQARTIRIPVHMVEELGRVRRVGRELERAYGREPKHGEIAKELGMDEGRVRMLLQADQSPVSLDFEFGEAGAGQTTTKLSDLLDDDDAQPGPAEVATHAVLREAVDDLLTRLDERTRKIVQMRHGLAGYAPMTLESIAQEFDLTRERIRQIDAKAMYTLFGIASDLGMQEFLID
jgi:RNA polymerase sigma factor (sigma-70 family)